MKNKICSFLVLLISVATSCNNDKTKEAGENTPQQGSPAYVKELATAVAKRPDSVGLRFNYIAALDSVGNYKVALEQVDSLLAHDKGNYALWFKKAQISEHAGDTTSAIRFYNAALNIYQAPDGLLALANLYAETKNPKTIEICQHIDEMRLGRDYDAYTAFFAGVYFARIGTNDKAIQLFDKSIDNNYTLMDAYIEKGYIYYETKKFNEALNVFSTAVSVNNRFADAYYWQGKCLEALNKKQEAINKYQQALTLDNTITEAQEAIKRIKWKG